MKRVYRFTLDNYTLCKRVSFGKDIFSSSFTAGGHKWAIVVSLNKEESVSRKEEEEEDVYYFGICVTLKSSGFRVPFRYKLRLVDQSGEGNHLIVEDDHEPILIDSGQKIGSPCLIRQDLLEESSYLKDDCLKIECVIDLLLSPPAEEEIRISGPQRSGDVGLFFLGLLETGEGADVIFNVGGMDFRAHKSMLSAHSSVFESMFAASHHQDEVVITGIEPRVFKALLHFIYTDSLAEEERSLIDGYAFGASVSSTFGAKLLAAADKYDLRRLKSICESHLWRSISLKRFAETLMIAERCNASLLKNLCFGLAVDHCDDLEELDTFTILGNKCPLLLDELVDYLSKERVLKIEKEVLVAVDPSSVQVLDEYY